MPVLATISDAVWTRASGLKLAKMSTWDTRVSIVGLGVRELYLAGENVSKLVRDAAPTIYAIGLTDASR
jgi:hypothetical protein